jgi:hypothetical protein
MTRPIITQLTGKPTWKAAAIAASRIIEITVEGGGLPVRRNDDLGFSLLFKLEEKMSRW